MKLNRWILDFSENPATAFWNDCYNMLKIFKEKEFQKINKLLPHSYFPGKIMSWLKFVI